MKRYNKVPTDVRDAQEERLARVIIDGFDELINETADWLDTDEAKEFFFKRRGRLSQFFYDSGLARKWEDIVDKRARMGVDVTGEIYEYARELNLEEDLRYTPSEIATFNKLCDYNYELIRNVSDDTIRGIRQHLLQDYARGENPRRTSLREVPLEPINGWTPEQRAVVIARTESARAINSATLEMYRRDGIEFVTLLVSSDCAECLAYAQDSEGNERLVPVGEALEEPCIHPNCRCAWVPSTGQLIGGGTM